MSITICAEAQLYSPALKLCDSRICGNEWTGEPNTSVTECTSQCTAEVHCVVAGLLTSLFFTAVVRYAFVPPACRTYWRYFVTSFYGSCYYSLFILLTCI